jgi:catechol 2,3-dioxygenase-like lactoylglutathione lyase family enzyme
MARVREARTSGAQTKARGNGASSGARANGAPGEARANGAPTQAFTSEDVGNVVALEHVNVTQPEQPKAMLFYLVGMGFTRDPYMNVGLNNIWVNVGEQQFHLPTRPPQVIPGHIGIVVPDLDALEQRLAAVREPLADTKFAYSRENGHVAATCPWGNQFRCYAPDARFGDIVLGLPYVEFQVRPGAAAGIARFYEQVLRAPSRVEQEAEGTAARVEIGTHQWLTFRETEGAIPPYDGHHIAIYVANFSEPYNFLKARGLIMEEPMNHQFRFKEIVDPDSGEHLHTLEHEVRGLHHAMYRRFMVNRNPEQRQQGYVRGHDALIPFRA